MPLADLEFDDEQNMPSDEDHIDASAQPRNGVLKVEFSRVSKMGWQFQRLEQADLLLPSIRLIELDVCTGISNQFSEDMVRTGVKELPKPSAVHPAAWRGRQSRCVRLVHAVWSRLDSPRVSAQGRRTEW